MTAAAVLARGTAHPARGAQETARATLLAVRRASRETGGHPAPVWWARLAEQGPASGEHSLVAVHSDRFPDGTPVDLTALQARGRRPAGWLVDVRYRTADGAVVRVDLADESADRCPSLWFTEVHSATSGVPSVSLLAFRGADVRPGSLLGPHQVAALGLRTADAVAEVRWWTRSGVVDTVRVIPELRRRGVGRAMVTVAEALGALRGWAPLRSDGRLTDAGAAWLAAAPAHWAPRLAARSERLPDEVDAAEPTGVARLLR
jgi:GNAT superfamily N-acetyltransferase